MSITEHLLCVRSCPKHTYRDFFFYSFNSYNNPIRCISINSILQIRKLPTTSYISSPRLYNCYLSCWTVTMLRIYLIGLRRLNPFLKVNIKEIMAFGKPVKWSFVLFVSLCNLFPTHSIQVSLPKTQHWWGHNPSLSQLLLAMCYINRTFWEA